MLVGAARQAHHILENEMPRIANNTDSLLNDLTSRLGTLIETARAEGREGALADLRGLMDGKPRPSKRRGRGATAKTSKLTKSGKKRKNPWAGLTPAQKLKRVNAIRKGRRVAACR